MADTIVYFKMKNEQLVNKIPIQGVYIQVKDLRQKIKEQLRINTQVNENMTYINSEELQLFEDQDNDTNAKQVPDKALCLADKVRNKQTVIVIRQPAQTLHSLCRSCFNGRFNHSTPCCQQPICSSCDSKFIQLGKCFFNMNSQCQFKYVNYTHQPVKFQNEVSNLELDQSIKNAVFFIVKSNNEQNVNLAKQYNCWATTRKNFVNLQNEFNSRNKVFLIFTANRIEKYLGTARMVNTYLPKDPKWSWHATSSIQLADNFQIEWLRKGHVEFSKLQDTINPKTGDFVTKSRDCQEVPSDIGQRICLLFEQIKVTDEETPQQQQYEPIPEVRQEPIQQNDDWDLDKIITEHPEEKIASPVHDRVSEPNSVSKSSSPSPKAKPDQANIMQMALLQSLYQPMLISQQMEANWMSMNKGKIPGLTGKVQYPHPFLQRMAHKQNKNIEHMLQSVNHMKSSTQQKRNRSSSRSPSEDRKQRRHKDKDRSESKSRRNKDRSQSKHKKRDRSQSPDKKKLRKKSKDRKEKKSKHKKQRSRSRSHKKSKKH